MPDKVGAEKIYEALGGDDFFDISKCKIVGSNPDALTLWLPPNWSYCNHVVIKAKKIGSFFIATYIVIIELMGKTKTTKIKVIEDRLINLQQTFSDFTGIKTPKCPDVNYPKHDIYG